MIGRWKNEGNQFPPSNKLVQEPEGNEENRYSDPDSNKTKLKYAKEPNEAHKNNLKEEILGGRIWLMHLYMCMRMEH
jgi:hypothetical protein